jgi:malate permease and related proteins
MTETLFHAYTPLILWTSLGLFIFKFLPQWFPRLLGRGLYWFGIPLQLLALARQSHLDEFGGEVSLPLLAPIITLSALVVGCAIASLVLWAWRLLLSHELKSYWTKLLLPPALDSSFSGSFVLCAVLGNTGFVGLAIAPTLIHSDALNWAVLYSITHNVIGTFGFGVVIASYFSHSEQQNRWWMQLRDVVSVPPLWAFLFGYLTRSVQLPELIESGLQASVNIVIAFAFLLTGIRLAQLQGWKSLKLAFVPAFLRVFLTPLLIGLGTTLFFQLSGSPRLAMVLMSGVPTAFAGLILAEEYNLDRDLIASSIIISTLLLLLVLPVWIVIFGS